MERGESDLFATNTESKRLMKRLITPEGVEERRLVSLHQLEQLIQTHRVGHSISKLAAAYNKYTKLGSHVLLFKFLFL